MMIDSIELEYDDVGAYQAKINGKEIPLQCAEKMEISITADGKTEVRITYSVDNVTINKNKPIK